MTKTTKTTAAKAKTTAKPVATKKAASAAVTAKAVSVKAKAKAKKPAAEVVDVDGPVTLTVAFKKDLGLTKRLERAAHKHGTAKAKAGGMCDMRFIFKRKSAFAKAVDRIKERFGADVTIAVAGAAA